MCACSNVKGVAGSVDRVTNFIHIDRDEEVTFLRLITPVATLELSPNHIVFVAAVDGSRKPVLAETVRAGGMLLDPQKPSADL